MSMSAQPLSGRLVRLTRALPVLASFLLLASAGCREEGIDYILMKPIATFTPEVVMAEPSTNPDFDWMTTFTVVVTETSGVMGGDIKSVLVQVVDDATDIQVEGSLVEVDPETARLDSGSVAMLDIVVHYGLPGGARQANIGVNILLIDDNPVSYARSVLVPIL